MPRLKVDIRIMNGTIIDPEQGISGSGEVLIKGNRIVESQPGATVEAGQTIDAQGCLVMPGLIDFHAHLFNGGTDAGINPDVSLLPMGVTTAVDAGSCGAANYESFVQAIVNHNQMRLFGLLNVSSGGIITNLFHEELNPVCYDEANIKRLLERYSGQIVGLKVRQSTEIVGELGMKPLEATIKVAEQLNCPVVVHTTNPPGPIEEIINYLRPGDVFCHVHHGTGQTILSEDGKVKRSLFKAQDAGILFDAANGRNNFSLKVAAQAIEEGFLPDIISSDVTSGTLYGKFVFGLPYVMMKYLNLGMSIEQIVAACTMVPARFVGMQGQIGTLKPGAFADVAIFRLSRKEVIMGDKFGNSITADQYLLPQLTILNGKIVFKQIDF